MRTRIALGIIACLLLALPADAGEGKPSEKGGARPPIASSSVAPKSKPKATGWDRIPLPPAAQKGIKWLVIGQNADGGWSTNGQGKAPHQQHLPGHWNRSDLGNTALAALAILATGSTPSSGTFQRPLQRAVDYILDHVTPLLGTGNGKPPTTPRRGQTQLEGKIGRYAPVYLSARVLTRVDGKMPTEKDDKRVRRTLAKLVADITKKQNPDGSWNAAGGWAPIHSTSYASKTLWAAQAIGIEVDDKVFKRVNEYTQRAMRGSSSRPPSGTPPPKRRGRPGRSGPVTTPGSGTPSGPVSSGSAGVHLYSLGQAIEQLTRTPDERKANVRLIREMATQANSEATLKGLGTMGGEEFISYHNINLAMARIGGREALFWNVKMKKRMAELQNGDGSWSGHHCITGRTACTSTAIMTLVAERSVPRIR